MNTENNKKVLDLIYNSVTSEGGDGDAVWLSKYTSLNEIEKLIIDYNTENKTNWTIEKKDNEIIWGDNIPTGLNQECIIITDSKEIFNSQPSWIILKIDY